MKETKIEKLILNLSNRWDCSPQEAVDRLNSMNESEINKLINSMTKKFKNGGMIDCLRKGGSIKDCGCGAKIKKSQGGGVTGGNWRDYHTIINAPGDTLRFKQYYSGPTTMQTHPEGGVTYTKSTVDGISHMYGNGYKPNFWEKYVLRMSPVDSETESNWQQLIENHKNDPAVKDKTQKKEMGGELKKNDSKAGNSKKLVNHEKEWGKTQKMETQKMETPPKDKKKTFVKLEHLKNVQNTKPIKPLNYKK